MNRIILNVSFVIAQCKRFIQYLEFNLKAQAFIQQINKCDVNHSHIVRRLHVATLSLLDRLGTLRREPLKGSGRAASRIARTVALAIGISLCLPMSHASSGSIDAINPKNYIKAIMPKHEAQCLSKLIGKESSWNTKAIGNLKSPNKNYTYGLLQLKNPIVKDKSAIEQIHYGLRYINHRYSGSSCLAWKHFQRKGWH